MMVTTGTDTSGFDSMGIWEYEMTPLIKTTTKSASTVREWLTAMAT
jgi:hypothetical protein